MFQPVFLTRHGFGAYPFSLPRWALAIGQRFGDVNAAYRIDAIKIGNRARNLQHAGIAPCGEIQPHSRIGQQGGARLVWPGDLFQFRQRRIGIDRAAGIADGIAKPV